METVDAYFPLYLAGHPFATPYEADLQIRPMYDETFKWDITADILYLGKDDKMHPVNEQLAREILEDIRRNDKDKWAQIVSAAKANFAPEFA